MQFKKVKFAVFTHLSLPIVEILLQHGATLEGSDTWAQVLEYSSHSTDLMLLLLRYGSDLLIP